PRLNWRHKVLNKDLLRAAPTEPLIADIRVGCCAVYPESRIEDSPGLNQSQRRNVAYSTKGAKFVNGHWEMDETTAAYYRLFAAAPTLLAEHDVLCELVDKYHRMLMRVMEEMALVQNAIITGDKS